MNEYQDEFDIFNPGDPSGILEKLESSELMTRNILKVVSIIFPFFIFVVNIFVKSSPEDGKLVESRPPAGAFALIWTLVIFGIVGSWYLMVTNVVENDVVMISSYLYIIIVILAMIWQWIYQEIGKKQAVWILWILVLFTCILIIYCLNYNMLSAILLCPLAIWGIYAAIMNMIEVQEENRPTTTESQKINNIWKPSVKYGW